MSARTEMRLRVILAVVLLMVMVGGGIDLVLDRPQSWLSLHVVFESLMIAAAAVTATALWLGWWRSERSAAELRRAVDVQAAERDRWRESAERALEGLARAIDEQFVRWRLTPTEREIAFLVLKGYGHKEIAAMTGRSERTVRQHAGVVYEKSGLAGRAELAAFFLQDLILPEVDRATLHATADA